MALLTFILAVSMVLPISMADKNTPLEIEIIETVGVELSCPSQINMGLGETEGGYCKIINKGNIRDEIMLEGKLQSDNKWIKFEYICSETIGDCEGHKASNIQLTPEINSTKVYLEVSGYRVGTDEITTSIWSQTNATKIDQEGTTINIKTKTGGAGPFGTPGLNLYGFIVTIILASLVVLKRSNQF